MENYISNRGEAKSDYRLLMSSVKENATMQNEWACPNEANMINKIVLGKKARQFREDNNIEDSETRAYLTAEEIYYISRLQKVDFGLVEAGLNYQQRKEILTKYYKEKLLPKPEVINNE